MAASLLTLIVARLAHWDGLQPYSDDNTSKSNLVTSSDICVDALLNRDPRLYPRFSPF